MNETYDSNRKIRPDDMLGQLPREQQDLIVQWLGRFSYREVLEKIAAPPPTGLGLPVHYNSLRRFYIKNLPDRLTAGRREELAGYRGVAELIEAEPNPYNALTREALERHIFQLSLSLYEHSEQFLRMSDLELRTRAQRLKEKYYDLAKQKAERPATQPKSEVNVQVFAALQAQIESTLRQLLPATAHTLAEGAPAEARLDAQTAEAEPLLQPASEPGCLVEKTRINTD